MTKKSQGRLQRDAQAKAFNDLKSKNPESIENNCWDELNEISNKCSEALIVANTQLKEVYKTEGLINFIPKKEEVIVALRGIAQDIKFFGEDLSRIKKMHEDKTGGFKDENDLTTTLTVFEEYANFQTKYESVILPTVVFLLEQADMALEKGTKKVVAEEVENPTVTMVQKQDVSDVSIIN
jgi:hypothetical protein